LYTYDAANELVTQQAGATVTTYTYDPNGNLLAENEAGSITTLTWGYEDELLTAQASNGTLTTMTYDGDLKRRKRAQAASWTTYLWDGQQIVLELDKNDNTTVRYTQAPRGYGDLVSQRRSSTTSFFHFDAIGTTRALTDASQSVTDTYIMRAFGTYRATTGSTVNNFRYIGRLGYYRETAISGFLLRRRYYAPEVGRFVSRDPVWTAGMSGYAYGGNRATRAIDASGLYVIDTGSCLNMNPNSKFKLLNPWCLKAIEEATKWLDQGKQPPGTVPGSAIIMLPLLPFGTIVGVQRPDCLKTIQDCMKTHGEPTIRCETADAPTPVGSTRCAEAPGGGLERGPISINGTFCYEAAKYIVYMQRGEPEKAEPYWDDFLALVRAIIHETGHYCLCSAEEARKKANDPNYEGPCGHYFEWVCYGGAELSTQTLP
jgi:RHS repeat-associated protein